MRNIKKFNPALIYLEIQYPQSTNDDDSYDTVFGLKS